MGAKPYDGRGNPKAAWLWLDRVNKIYEVIGYTDDQRVLFSSFLMKDRAKDWWDAVDRRYPEGISWDQFQQEFTDIFFPQSHKDSKIEEFFRLEQKNMSVSVTGPDPDTPPGFPGWSHLMEFHCTIPRECTRGPHLKEK